MKTSQIVTSTDFVLYPLLLPHFVSEPFQNLPFCNLERDLQGHTLLGAVTPPRRHLSFVYTYTVL